MHFDSKRQEERSGSLTPESELIPHDDTDRAKCAGPGLQSGGVQASPVSGSRFAATSQEKWSVVQTSWPFPSRSLHKGKLEPVYPAVSHLLLKIQAG